MHADVHYPYSSSNPLGYKTVVPLQFNIVITKIPLSLSHMSYTVGDMSQIMERHVACELHWRGHVSNYGVACCTVQLNGSRVKLKF